MPIIIPPGGGLPVNSTRGPVNATEAKMPKEVFQAKKDSGPASIFTPNKEKETPPPTGNLKELNELPAKKVDKQDVPKTDTGTTQEI